jgi:site-specific DNA-cytosine methylase
MQPSGLFGDLESIIEQPKDRGILLKDILESEVDEKYFLSEKMLKVIKKHGAINDVYNDKSNCILQSYYKMGGRDQQYTVHNTMPRSSTSGKGGTGPLSRSDGKTYCLDTGNTNAVEVRQVKQISTNNKSNGGTQHYQQDRIYDINGISPALQAQLPKGSTMINTSRIRRLTPIECERLQTVADNYTNHVSDSQRYKMLGNGWTIEVIIHILKYITL